MSTHAQSSPLELANKSRLLAQDATSISEEDLQWQKRQHEAEERIK